MSNKKTTTKIAIRDLIERQDVLSIRRPNDVTVSQYRQAMRNGDKFPPIVINERNEIVCGYTRTEAYRQEYGEEHKVSAQVIEFANDAELVKYAVADNSKHGQRLDGISRKRACIELSKRGVTPEEIGKILGVSVQRVEMMGGQVVYVRGSGKKRELRPVKHGLQHIAGTTVSEKEYEQHERADRGVSARQNAQQLIRWIDNGWIDQTDEKTMAALDQLHAALVDFMR